MGILSADRIRLQATATSKQDAIRQAGDLLVQTGCVDPGYVDGMLARETVMSTYLGSGVAIPHGQHENRDQIHQTAISVLQLVDGVLWEEEDDEKAYLIIGIAANSDDHIGVLAALAEAVEDEETIQNLLTTADPRVILDCLDRSSADLVE